MEEFGKGNRDRRIVGIHFHDIGHHVPPALGDGIHIVGVLRTAFALTLLIGKEDVGVFVPVDAVVAHALILDHLFEFGPNGIMPLFVFLLKAWFEEHLECKTFCHICQEFENLRILIY